MPRLLGVDIPNDKPSVISLTYLYGVGPKVARDLCHKAGIDPQKRARELAEDELGRLSVLARTRLHGGRSVAAAGAAEHQPLAGHQVLSRHPASAGIARAWPADADQCADPQGTAEDRGRQEGREGSAVVAGRDSRQSCRDRGRGASHGSRQSGAVEMIRNNVGASRQWRRARNANFVGT